MDHVNDYFVVEAEETASDILNNLEDKDVEIRLRNMVPEEVSMKALVR